MPEPTLLRLQEITHVGFVDVGANQEDGEGAFIEIWKRADHTEEKKTMDFDPKDLDEDAQKAFAALQEATKKAEEASETAATATKDAEAKLEKAEADLAEAQKKEEPEEDDVLKGLPEDVQKVIAAQQEKSEAAIAKAQSEAEEATKKAEAAGEVAKAEREKRERQEYAEVAKKDMSDLTTENLGDQLYESRQVMSDEAFESYTTTLKAASEQARLAKVLEETGAAASGTVGGAWDEVEALAKALVAKGDEPTQAQAVTKVLETNPELYDRYKAEQASA